MKENLTVERKQWDSAGELNLMVEIRLNQLSGTRK